jgi:AraC family transcriptional regulator
LEGGRQVLLEFRDDEAPPDARHAIAWRGLSAEHVTIRGAREFAYKWVGSNHYLALHDLKLDDGETALDASTPVRQLDLRGRMTFIPRGCGISGWSHLSRRAHAFTAVYFDPAILPEELDGRGSPSPEAPMLYFDNPGLRSTVAKVQTLLLKDPSPMDGVYAETLGLLAAIEIDRLQNVGTKRHVPASGRLSAGQEALVRDYIVEHLQTNISLSDLAGLVQLSRFHFTRAFKKTFGLPPHQFILQARIDRAKLMLRTSDVPMLEIAHCLGFGSQSRFSEAFRKITGSTPRQLRRLDQ